MPNIALVLPAYNESSSIEKSLKAVKKGTLAFPEHEFTLFPIDDGSTDKTFEAIQYWGKKYGLQMEPSRNPENLGVVETLKKTYQKILDRSSSKYILKTDLDSDFDQELVLRKMIPLIENSAGAAGIRWRPIREEENPYEFARRQEITELLERELGLGKLDPPSAGSQIYKPNTLRCLLQEPIVENHNKRWGLDFLLPLLAIKLGFKIPIINIENGNYNPARRPKDKVKAQYDTYFEIIGKLTGKNPKMLSKYYG